MGAANSCLQNEELYNKFVRSDWKILNSSGLYQIWQNKKTNEICQAYTLQYIPEEKHLEHYRFRHDNQNASYFVSIRYVSILEEKSFCSAGQSYVLTQYIPVKLSDMKNLTLPESFSLLRASFCGFNTIEAFHGPFTPSEQMIGVNLKGKPKVWLNKDHSKDSVDSNIKTKISQKHQGQVSENVRKILEMTEEKLRQKHFPSDFKSYFYDNMLNFFQAYQFIEEYCQKTSIQIQQHVDYLRFIQDEQIYEIITDYFRVHNSTDLNLTNELNALPQKFASRLDNSVSAIPKVKSTNKMIISQRIINQQLSNIQDANAQPNQFSKVLLQHSIVNRHFIPNSNSNVNIHINQKSLQKLQRVSTLPTLTQISYVKNEQSVKNQQYYRVSPAIIMSPPPRIIINNKQTPLHFANGTQFKSPSKITQFQQPFRRVVGQKTQNSPSSKQLVTITESKYCGQAHQPKQQDHELNNSNKSIHEKINKALNEESLQESQQNINFNNYINQHSEEQKNEIEDQNDNMTSQPDWEQSQQQNPSHSDGLNSQQQRYRREHMQNLEDDENNCLEQKIAIEMNRADKQVIDAVQQKIILGEQNQQNKEQQKYIQSEQQNAVSEVQQQYTYKLTHSINTSHTFDQNMQISFNPKYHLQTVEENHVENHQNDKNFGQSGRTLVIHESQEKIEEQTKVNFFKKQLIVENVRNQQFVKSHGEITHPDENHYGEPEESHCQPYDDEYQSKLLEMQKIDLDYPVQISAEATGEGFHKIYQGLHFRNESDQFYQYKPSSSKSNKQFISNIQRNTNSGNEIGKLQSQKQIQDYIKNKYSHMFEGPSKEKIERESSQRTMTFAKQYGQQKVKLIPTENYVDSIRIKRASINFNNNYKQQVEYVMENIESQYYKPHQSSYTSLAGSYKSPFIESIENRDEILDVKNLEQKLDKKYQKNRQSKQYKIVKEKISGSHVFQEEDQCNVAVLDKKLQKFEQKQNLEKSQTKSQQKPIQNLENLSELDNFVEMMDKKIQQSQSRAKIVSSRSGTNKDLNPKYDIPQKKSYPLDSIPKLKRQKSKKQYEKLEVNLQPKEANTYASKETSAKRNQLDKVFSFSKKVIEPSLTKAEINDNPQQKKRVSKRLSTALDANKLALEIQKKYQKHLQKSAFEEEIKSKPFRKKKESLALQSISQNSIGPKYLSNRIIDEYTKTVSYIKPYGESYSKISAMNDQNKKKSIYLNSYQNYESYKTLSSNKSSNQNSKKSIGLANGKRTSKVSYSQLRDLLWN